MTVVLQVTAGGLAVDDAAQELLHVRLQGHLSPPHQLLRQPGKNRT